MFSISHHSIFKTLIFVIVDILYTLISNEHYIKFLNTISLV